MNWKQDDGVSNIIGAVIFTALLVSTMVVVRVDYVPLLEEDREAQSMRKLADEMGLLKSDIDRQVDDRLNVPMSNGLTVGRQGSTGFMRPVKVPGDVTFSMYDATNSFQLTSPELLMQSGTGAQVFGVAEPWQTLVDGTTLTNVSSMHHLRVRITDPDGQTDGDSATITLTDASGNYAGKVNINFMRVSSDYVLETEVYSAASAVDPINVRTESFKGTYAPAYYYRNLLASELLFDQIIEAAEKPVRLRLNDYGLPGSFAAGYRQINGGVEVNVGDGGIPITLFERSAPAGRLVVDAPNQYFPAQQYIYEYGGVILAQEGQEVMLVPPQFTIAATTNQIQLELVVPTPTGANGTTAGVPQYVVRSAPVGQEMKFQAKSAELTLSLETDYPRAWMGFWNDTLGAAGLSVAAGHYTVDRTITGATLNLIGTQSGTEKEIFINMAQSRIGLSVRAAS